MKNHRERFTNRVENYIRYRPGYPAEIISILSADCGLSPAAVVADVGSGTGILAEMFLKNGNRVIGIEPNAPMRLAAEKLLSEYESFDSIEAAAEATTLESESVDFITAGQAFHWFDVVASRREFKRILRPNGWVVLVWNERLLDTTVFLRDYEALLLRYGTDYQEIRHEKTESQIGEFFEPAGFRLKTLNNLQSFDLAGLTGRVNSSSYVPEPGHPNFKPLHAELEEIFRRHEVDGRVAFEYETKMFYGQLS